MTWRFTDGTNATTNQTPTTAVEAVWRLKQMLKNMGAIVVGSGDGLSAYNLHPTWPYDATHYDVFTAGTPYGSGANGMNNSQAWFVLKLPDGRMLAFQRGSSGTTYWRVVYMPSDLGAVPPVQTLTSGSSTLMALAPVVNYIKGTAGSTAGTAWFGTDGTYRWNAAYDDATYAFWVACWTSGGALTDADGAFFYDPLASGSYPTEDKEPPVLYCPDQSGSASNRPWAAVTIGAESTSYSPKSYLRRGMAGEGFVVVTALSYGIAAGTPVFPLYAGSNPHNFKEDGLPIIFARRAGVSAPGGYKGASSFLRWLGAGRGTGQALTLSTTRDRLAVAEVSLPWDGSVPLV